MFRYESEDKSYGFEYSFIKSVQTLFPLLIIVFFSNLTEACAGFGATILAIIFGAQYFAIEDLIPILVPLNVLLSLVIVVRYRKEIDYRILLTRILPIAGLGMPIGILIFQNAPSPILKIAFGIIVVILGIFELTVKSENRPLLLWKSVLFLVSGGVMQGLYASGGPFVVYYASREIQDKRRFRTTLAGLWLILNLILVASLVLSGKLTRYTLMYSVYLLPSVILGMGVGMKLHDRVSEMAFKRLVYALLIFAGASLAYRTAITQNGF